MKLLERIERHLKDTHMSATRFGRRAVGDPRFVLDLRMGRRPRRRTLERVEAYLEVFSNNAILLSEEQGSKEENKCSFRNETCDLA